MALFQKGIYTWNKDDMASHMNTLEFMYEIQPYAKSYVGNQDGFKLTHMDKEIAASDQKSSSQAQFEETIRSIFFYKNSYFRAVAADGIFESFRFSGFNPPDSDSYCIGTMWHSKDALVANDYTDIDDMPLCSNGLNPAADFSSGLSFDLYKWEAT